MRRRKRNALPLGLKLILVLALVLLIAACGLAIVATLGTGNDTPTDSSTPPTDVTTTVTTTVATTTTTAAPTTTTQATAAPTKPGTKPTLLQYDTSGRYVQMETTGGSVDWNLRLVNDWNAMPEGYESSVSFVAVGNNQKADSRIVDDLQAMLAAGKAHGIGVQSGYRSAEHQGTLYWRQVNNQKNWYGLDDKAAQEAAGKVVKRPGYSEHNTGLAVDLGGSGNFKLEMDFEDTPAFRWLIENCADYGFILRFPKGKESVTGVIYEPWHYRYVGKEAATYIMENDLCLEEYLAEQRK